MSEGIVKGLYRFAEGPNGQKLHKAQILASGPMVQQALRAQQLLGEEHDVSADVWSAMTFPSGSASVAQCPPAWMS